MIATARHILQSLSAAIVTVTPCDVISKDYNTTDEVVALAKVYAEEEKRQRELERQHELKMAEASGKRREGSQVLDKFQKILSVQLNEAEKQVFFTKFSNYFEAIASHNLNLAEARRLLRSIKAVLKSTTVRLMQNKGFVFCDLLGPTGGGKATLYRVISQETFEIHCGKVYLSDFDGSKALTSEITANSLIHKDRVHKNIVWYHTTVYVDHVNGVPSVALLMPLYHVTLFEVLEAYGDRVEIPFQHFRTIAEGLLEGGKCFQTNRLAHCDIKPGNIAMEVGRECIPVLIDLGSVTHFGQPAEEYTAGYPLDASFTSVDEAFDLNCIAVTLAQCFVPEFEVKHRNKTDLQQVLNPHSQGVLTNFVSVCTTVLSSTSCSATQQALAEINATLYTEADNTVPPSRSEKPSGTPDITTLNEASGTPTSI